MGRLSFLVVAAALVAVATGAAASAPPPGPRPTPKTMKITKESGRECISKWYVTGHANGKWVWADVDKCCPPRMPTKTMTVFKEGKRCVSTWTQCDIELNADYNCVRTWCDVTNCAEPVCPPEPMEMKTRYVKKNGERCVKTWTTCGKKFSGGKCTWKGCDIIKCLPPCPKPMAKTMRTKTADMTCVDNWWPATLTVDTSKDGMDCSWAWKDIKICHCRVGKTGKYVKC